MAYLTTLSLFKFNLVLEDGQRRIFRIVKRFDEHCSYHFQGECVRRSWKPYAQQAVDGELDKKVLAAWWEEERVVVQGRALET
jgi:hypothetical protein